MQILLTGGAGFIGSHLATALKADGHYVFVYDSLHYGPTPPRFDDKSQFILGDIRDIEKIEQILRENKIDLMINLAAFSSIDDVLKDEIQSRDVNVKAVARIASLCANYEIKLIQFSSAAVYGNYYQMPVRESVPKHPISLYGMQKLEAENWIRANMPSNKLMFKILRIFNVFGPGQINPGVITKMIETKKRGEPFYLNGEGEQTRDYIYVKDVCRAVQIIINRWDDPYNTYNVGNGRSYKAGNSPIPYRPLSLKDLAEIAGIDDIRYKPELEYDIKYSCSDNSAITKLGYRPSKAPEHFIRLSLHA